MTGPDYSEWLARGQQQQRDGRPVDALLCYRHALRLNRYAVQAQFHLGEVLQQLGRDNEAFDAWRLALTWQPRHVPTLLAFGAAARRIGNPIEATEAFRRALQDSPGDQLGESPGDKARQASAEQRADNADHELARASYALARLATAVAERGGNDTIAAVGAIEIPSLLRAVEQAQAKSSIPLVEDLAQSMARAAPSPTRRALLEQLDVFARREAWPLRSPLSLALLAESAIERKQCARARALLKIGEAASIDDAEALRRLARVAGALAMQGLDDAPLASAAASTTPDATDDAYTDAPTRAATDATRYAQRCVAVVANEVPLLWPRRTAGRAIRVAYLVAPGRPLRIGSVVIDIDDYVRHVIAAHPRDRIEASVYDVEDTTEIALGAGFGGGLASASNDDDPWGGTIAAETGVRGTNDAIPRTPIGTEPGREIAQRLAEADFDALVDLAGMRAAIGPLLARGPARTLWAPAGLLAAHAALLVPNALPAPGGSDAASLDAHRQAIESALEAALKRQPWFSESVAATQGSLPSPAAMARRWHDAVAKHQTKDVDAAVDAYRAVLALQDGWAPGHYLLGSLLRERGELPEAGRQLTAAVAAAPGYVDARVALADYLRAIGQLGTLSVGGAHSGIRHLDAAIATCEEGLARAPDEPRLWRSLGLAELANEHGAEARTAFERALTLAPGDAETHYNEGVALQMQRRHNGALRAYQRALALDPEMIAAEYNVGVVFRDQRRLDAAIAAFERVLARNPAHVQAHNGLGETLLETRRIDDWLRAFKRFEAHCPNALPLAAQALEACQYLGDLSAVDHYIDRICRDDFVSSSATESVDCLETMLQLLLYFDLASTDLLALYRRYGTTAAAVYGAPLVLSAVRKPGKLRIGYLSGDLRNHVMGKMMWEAVKRHDRERFELYFYSLSDVSDEWTQRYRDIADRFDGIAGLSEREAAARIAADDIDLLIDLSTHTRGAAPGILALKPARVQITHLASAGSVGLETIDFKLTDAFADLPENRTHQPETLLPMQGCAYPYRHIEAAASNPYRRERLNIAPATTVIGVFVNPMKLSRRCLATWRDVLERIPGAVLAISPLTADLNDVYRRLFAAAGIAPDRVIVIPAGKNDAENQSRYDVVDFVLDPMPYGGVNGTLEALDMGVPVVTLCGRKHGERTSYSILANLGVTATVAQSGKDYVELAARLATDAQFAADVRTSIRKGLTQSALVDMDSHTRNLERVYIQALELRYPALR